MKIINSIIISIFIISLIAILIFSNNFILLKHSNTSIEVNIMSAIFSQSEKVDQTAREETPKFGNKIKKKVKCHVPKFMLELYENNKSGFNTSGADVVRSVIPKREDFSSTDNMVDHFSDTHLLIFDLPTTTNDEMFIHAELKILTIIEKNEDSIEEIERKVVLSVYDEPQQEFVDVHIVHMYQSNNTWLSFNLTEQVGQILENESLAKNLKVSITISSVVSIYFDESKLKLSLFPSEEGTFEHEYPILLLSYISNVSYNLKEEKEMSNQHNQIRKRRFVEEDYEGEFNSIWDELISKKVQGNKLKRMRNNCKLKPLYIDFAEINYDEWIVQPSGYEAFQCQGKCFYPVAEHLSPTKHAIMQALLHSVSPSRASRSCCVPTSLDPISILYVDENGVLTYRYAYRNMVVRECGCR